MSYIEDARKIALLFLQKASKYEKEELMVLVKRWEGISKNLESLIVDLSNLESPSPNQLFKSGLYKEFLKEAQSEIEKYNSFALGTVKEGQSVFAKIGLETTQKQIGLVTVNFNKINYDAVKNMIGLTSKGSKLSTLFETSYPEVYDKLNQVMVNSISLGYGPKKTAGLLRQVTDIPRNRSLTIARTESLNCLRMSSLEQMRESGVVKGWFWHAEPDACDDCAEKDGQHFDLDEEMDEHPNGKCNYVPEI